MTSYDQAEDSIGPQLRKCARADCPRLLPNPDYLYCRWHAKGRTPCEYLGCTRYAEGRYCARHQPERMAMMRDYTAARGKPHRAATSIIG